MRADAVIGCDAVNVGTEWLRLTTTSGAVRSIPWSAIRLAGMAGGPEVQITIQGVTEAVAPYLATHDPLWIFYSEGGLVQIMLEKQSPKREPILAAIAKQLGDRWRGNNLQSSDLRGAMLIPAKIQIPRTLIIVMVAMVIIFFVSIAILFFVHGAQPRTSAP